MDLLAATNYTAIWTAAVTGATALVVSLVAYWTAKLSANVSLRQVEEETTRQREERSEKHFQHRQGLYHELLNEDRGFFSIPRPLTIELTRAWQSRVNDATNGVVLFGTAQAAQACLALHSVVAAVVKDVNKQEGDTYDIRVGESVKVHLKEWQAARLEFANAVRLDTSPDRAPIHLEPTSDDDDKTPAEAAPTTTQ